MRAMQVLKVIAVGLALGLLFIFQTMRIQLLQNEVEAQQKDIARLASASTKNSDAIKELADAGSTTSNNLEQLADATKSNSRSITVLADALYGKASK